MYSHPDSIILFTSDVHESRLAAAAERRLVTLARSARRVRRRSLSQTPRHPVLTAPATVAEALSAIEDLDQRGGGGVRLGPIVDLLAKAAADAGVDVSLGGRFAFDHDVLATRALAHLAARTAGKELPLSTDIAGRVASLLGTLPVEHIAPARSSAKRHRPRHAA